MARLWTCGFENQSATEWQTTNGAPTISTSVKRLGGASLRCTPTAGVAGIAHTLFTTGQAAGRFFLRAYVRVAAYPSARTAILGWSDNTTGVTGFMCIKLQTDGTLIAGGSAATTGTASAALALDTWYRIELDYDDAANTMAAYLNGVQWATASGDLGGGNIVRYGVLQTATADLYFDDVAINDTSGSVQTGLPGAGNVIHLRPDSAGDNNLWATAVGGTAGAANNYTRVAEVTPDDATSYNQTALTGTTTIDDFNLGPTFPAGITYRDAITLVAVGGRVGSTAATAASIVYRVKSQAAGTVVESASVSVALNGWATHKSASPFTYQLTSYVEPQAGGAWTVPLLEAAQIGYRTNVAQVTTRRVSSLWALVEFVPATPVPLATLQDDFNDNTVDTSLWPNRFGTYSETGKRARVVCDTNYNAYSSAKRYTLTGSSTVGRLYPPANGGSTAEAWQQFLLKSAIEGIDLGFEIEAGDTPTLLNCFSRVGYSDPSAVSITYDPVDHAFVRIREAAGTVYWDTSRNGRVWTNRKSVATPAWAADTGLELQLIAHRSDGTPDYVEYDNVGIPMGARVWTGSEWQPCPVRTWTGSEWKLRTVKARTGGGAWI